MELLSGSACHFDAVVLVWLCLLPADTLIRIGHFISHPHVEGFDVMRILVNLNEGGQTLGLVVSFFWSTFSLLICYYDTVGAWSKPVEHQCTKLINLFIATTHHNLAPTMGRDHIVWCLKMFLHGKCLPKPPGVSSQMSKFAKTTWCFFPGQTHQDHLWCLFTDQICQDHLCTQSFWCTVDAVPSNTTRLISLFEPFSSILDDMMGTTKVIPPIFLDLPAVSFRCVALHYFGNSKHTVICYFQDEWQYAGSYKHVIVILWPLPHYSYFRYWVW